MTRSTCFGHHYAHHQELDTTQIFTACGTCVQVEGCCSSNIPQPGCITYSHTPHLRPAITKVMCHLLWISV